MVPLWNPEKLISLCSHEDGDVRGWAAHRLAFLFPEKAAATMLRLLADPDELVVVEAIRYFSDHPKKEFVDELLAALKKSSGRIAGRLANAVALLGDARLLEVVREKYAKETGSDLLGFALVLVGVAVLGTPPSQEYVEASLSRLLSAPFKETFAGSFFAANLIAGTDMEKLLSFCAQAEAKELLPSLLFEALSRCGSWVSKDDLTEKPAKGSKDLPFVIQDSLECLGEHGYLDGAESLAGLFEKRRYDDIVRTSRKICAAILGAKSQASGEVSMRQWEEGKDMPFPYVSLLFALDATLDEMPKGFKETIARTAVAALSGVAELQSLIAIDPENLTKEAALRLFLEDRPTVPQDRRIMEILAADGRPDTVIEPCKNHLKEYAYSDAAPRIVDFLSRFMDEGLATCFLDLDFAGESLDDAILRAIGQLGVAAIPLLRPIFEQDDHDWIPLALQVLEDLPYQESADLLLSHWSALREKHGEWLLETVESLGDRRFIPLLRKELKEGEPEEDRIFRLLCLINRVMDPELKRIDREAEESRQKEERVMEAIEAGDFETLLSEPLDVSLTCRACNSVFHYRVRRVQVGIDSKDVIIMDPIVCKKCGTLDHYETRDDLIVAVTARLAMLDALPDEALSDLESMTVIPVETISALGKGVSAEKLIAKYEKKLAKNPENAELLLGYANVLRQVKRAEDAVPFYERVLERDPLAVEALGCLGDHAFLKGDFESAFARYGEAVEIMEKGHYYRVQADVDRFKEAMLNRLAETAERLGRTAPVVDARTGQAESHKRVGRNDPCPCGSGKKYKKCCLLKESGQGPVPGPQEPRRPVADPVYQGIQHKLYDYSRHIASRKDFLRGTALYWNTKPKDPLVLPDAAEKDQGEFTEWFIHDFRLDSGKTVVESFLETRGSSLTEKERALVEALSKSYRSIYEVQEVREGSGVTIKDVFTGDEMDVEEISGSYSMVQWDVIHIRVYTDGGIHKFGGNGRILPRKHLHDLLAYLNDAHRDARGGKPWSTFLKENSFLVGRFFDTLVENPPVFLTEEKHRVISARAHFVVSNYDRARNILVGQYDFGDPEEVRPQGIRLSWLKRGASKIWETGSEKIENAVVTTSSMVHPSGRLGWTVLGTVNLHPDKLTLECMSRERLERGKKRLEQLIGGFIRHRADEFEDIHVGMERVAQRSGGKEKPVPDEKARAIAASVMKRQLSTWPDQSLPALDGRTPREAVATNEGRQKVLDLIKDFENMEARRKKEGQVSMDLSFLRKELGV